MSPPSSHVQFNIDGNKTDEFKVRHSGYSSSGSVVVTTSIIDVSPKVVKQIVSGNKIECVIYIRAGSKDSIKYMIPRKTILDNQAILTLSKLFELSKRNDI
jgi:hypothetical protein